MPTDTRTPAGVDRTHAGLNGGRAPAVLLVLVPVAYALLYNIRFQTSNHQPHGFDGIAGAALIVLKPLSIIALAASVHSVGKLIAKKPGRATTAAVVWALAGAMLVSAVALAKHRGATLGIDQLWPERSNPELLNLLSPGPGQRWEPRAIIVTELVAVLALSALVAGILWLLARRPERLLVTALAMAAFFFGLLFYDLVAGWPIMFDFDPFVGDAALGALAYELGFVFLPFDPVGSLGLAAIAVANGALLTLWGNPRLPRRTLNQPK